MDTKNHYKILHEYKNEDQYLVMNEVTGEVGIRKTLKVFDKQVYSWIQSHPHLNLPHILEFFEEGDKLIVIEQLINGSTLDEYLQKYNPDLRSRLNILFQICDGLDHLHHAPSPIIHRDIKATNIIVTDTGNIKIIDFDASKVYKAGASSDTVLLGTEGSAAPEQYGFAQSDPRTDIYALGVLARQILPSTPRYNAVITKATSIAPKDRYQNVTSFKKALLGDTPAKKKATEAWTAAAIVIGTLVCAVILLAIMYISFKNTQLKVARSVIVAEDTLLTDGDFTEEQLQAIIDNPDYKNAEEFEYALNHGEDTEDSIVRFRVDSFHPNAGIGYPNIWAGDHLNFVSTENPDVKVGDILTVRICDARNAGIRWFISYEILDIKSG